MTTKNKMCIIIRMLMGVLVCLYVSSDVRYICPKYNKNQNMYNSLDVNYGSCLLIYIYSDVRYIFRCSLHLSEMQQKPKYVYLFEC